MSSQPASTNSATSSFIGSLFLPPTLIPRSSAIVTSVPLLLLSIAMVAFSRFESNGYHFEK